MCAYNGDQKAFLTNIAAYASACQAKSVQICDWRKMCKLCEYSFEVLVSTYAHFVSFLYHREY